MFEKPVAPVGAGLAVDNQPVIYKEANKHLDRYVFCLEDIDLWDRVLSSKYVHRGRFTRFSDISYAGRDMSEEALTRENLPNELDRPIIQTFIKSAADSALEVYAAYGSIGLVVVNSLTGKDIATVRAIEQELLNIVPDSLQEFYDILAKKEFGANKPGEVTRAVRDELIECIRKTVNYREDIVNKAEAELAQRALPGGQGLTHITNGTKFYATSLDRSLKAERLEQIASKQSEPVQVHITQPANAGLDAETIASIVSQAAAEAAKAAVEAAMKNTAKK